MAVYYVAGHEANYTSARDALYAAYTHAERYREEQRVMVDTGYQVPYCFAKVNTGDQA